MRITKSEVISAALQRWVRSAVWSGVFTVAAGTVCITSLSGQEAASEAPNLQAILPDVAPDGVGPAEFEALGGNWAEWSTNVSEMVVKLYEEDLDPAAQAELIGQLKKKLAVMKQSLADPKYRSIHDTLDPVFGGLSRRVDLMDAMAASLQLDPAAARQSQLAASGAAIESALKDLAADLQKISGGSAWNSYVLAEELRTALAGEGEASGVVQKSLNRLSNLEKLNDEQRAFLTRQAFADLKSALQAYLEDAGREIAPIDQAAVHSELKTLVEALEGYESTSRVTSARQARDSYRKLSGMLPDGGELLGKALRAHYFNYNLHVIASEGLMSRLVGEVRNETGPVRDFILGANVSGTQMTRSEVGVDLKPSNSNAALDITVSGVVRSSTQGVTPEATIFTSGYHRFWAAKEVRFDGDSLQVQPARIYVDANNTTTGARTKISGVPLIGGFTEGIARSEARKKRPQSEAIAASRVSDRVLPKFNSEVDEQIEKANVDLQEKLIKKLEEADLFPSARRIYTTDSQLLYSSRTMSDHELGGSRPFQPAVPSKGLLLQLHESVANNALDRMALAGRTLSEDELKVEIEKSLSDLLGREVKLGESAESEEKPAEAEVAAEDEDVPSTFVFDDSDPIRVRFRGNEIELVIRAALKQEGKEDIPAQEISVPLVIVVEGDNLNISAGRVRVSPVEKPESLQTQIARAGVIRKKIDRAIVSKTVDGTVELERDNGSPLALKVQTLTSRNGWLSLTLE